MRRGHGRSLTDKLIEKFRNTILGVALRTTLIVGYPGETREQFEELKEWVEEMRFDRLGVFAYSHEENTHAGMLEDNIPQEEKQRRVDEIMSIQARISYELNQQKIGKVYPCVIDRLEGDYYIGRTEFDSPDVDNEVLIEAREQHINPGEFIQVRITRAGTYDLYGEVEKG
jgi:ribosomal protein S12 methylthiotransferase